MEVESVEGNNLKVGIGEKNYSVEDNGKVVESTWRQPSTSLLKHSNVEFKRRSYKLRGNRDRNLSSSNSHSDLHPVGNAVTIIIINRTKAG